MKNFLLRMDKEINVQIFEYSENKEVLRVDCENNLIQVVYLIKGLLCKFEEQSLIFSIEIIKVSYNGLYLYCCCQGGRNKWVFGICLLVLKCSLYSELLI